VIVSSDLIRAEKTAQIIGRAIGVQPMVLPPTERPRGDEEAPSAE
jgi:hypothetical protein